ncbi:hypothetical protein RUU60_09115 [Escherichia coli]|uniref:hypothetical protein n=1 Tax=Escherichia coli TaxID=562 RepID=UPI0028FC2BE9|nr:hypothetical protein [Escherichia coli]WNW46391.1 hypothetical protein RUU60_09115 [Escherichia coli]
MQTINNRMTATQVADLFSLAVQLQVKAEESDDRDTAILAYSIQNACSNLTESRREFWAADATINNLELKITDMAEQLANAESKCRELAAELSAVDKIHNEAVFITDEHYEQSPPEVQKMIRSLAVLKIPAYDAFLAEVRACALEYYANLFKDTVNMDVKHNQEFHKGTLYVADQLRKGASL